MKRQERPTYPIGGGNNVLRHSFQVERVLPVNTCSNCKAAYAELENEFKKTALERIKLRCASDGEKVSVKSEQNAQEMKVESHE